MSEREQGAVRSLEQRCASFRERTLRIREALGRVLLGQGALTDQLLMGIFAGGHVLVEGVPGLGKTLLVKSVARTLGLNFRRVQFTPDLLPGDILGARTLVQGLDDDARSARIEFQPGPVFTHVLLADEINRSGPKTQSALLEAMEERQVTLAGETYPIEEPFTVLATHNPIEQEGTYPLPEAQLDRFLMRLRVRLPGAEHLVRILDFDPSAAIAELPVLGSPTDVLDGRRLAREVPIGDDLKEAVAQVILAAQPGRPDDPAARHIRLGLSPRAGQAWVAAAKVRALMQGRYHVSREDLAALAEPILSHRIMLSFSAQADSVPQEAVVRDLAARVRLASKA